MSDAGVDEDGVEAFVADTRAVAEPDLDLRKYGEIAPG